MNSFLTPVELAGIGLKSYGKNVLISRFARFYSPETISVGDHVRIDDFCIISGNVTIGSYIHISAYCAMYGRYGIEINSYSGISPRCTIFSASDDFSGDFLIGPVFPEEYTNLRGGKVTIKQFVQIGAGSVIMPDLVIEEGVALGVMSFVKESLQAWHIYAGNPLRMIKKRNQDLLTKFKEFHANR